MFPHLVIGSLKLNSFAIVLALSFLLAWRLLRLNLARYGLRPDIGDKMILVLMVSGLLGSKLYHVLQTPSNLLHNPGILISPSGSAWAGGLLAGIAGIFALARYLGLNPLLLLDSICPSGAIAYGVGRLGCLLAGDGDYGVPTSLPWGLSFPHGLVPTFQRVHPTPIYEAIVGTLIFLYLWRKASRKRPAGSILARYLILSGTVRFLVEFIRINPRSFLGLTNAQTVSVLCVVAGILLFLRTERFSETGRLVKQSA